MLVTNKSIVDMKALQEDLELGKGGIFHPTHYCFQGLSYIKNL